MIKETIIRADDSEIEAIAQEVFGDDDYCFHAVQVSDNDTSHSFDVDGKLDEYDQKDVDEMLESNRIMTYRNQKVLNYLAKIGKIETGNYIIEVCW